MFNQLLRLLAEQTTPLELTYFIVLVSAICVLAAAAFYAVTISIIWMMWLRPKIAYPRLFLPTRGQLKAFLPEYVLALATAAVLAATIAEKHELVDAILNYEVTSLPAHDVEALFPFHRIPNARELGDDEKEASLRDAILGEGQRSVDAYAASVLKPVLQAGRAGEVRRLLGLIVPEVAVTPSAKRALRRALFAASLFLVVAYVLWLAAVRGRSLRSASDAAMGYREALHRVAIVGVTLALLLASPALVGDTELLADSAFGALRHESVDDSSGIAAQIALGLDAQYETQGAAIRALGHVEEGDDMVASLESLGRQLDRLGGLEERLQPRLQGIESTVDALGQQVDTLAVGLGGLNEEVAALGLRLAGVEGSVAALAAQVGDLERRSEERDRLIQEFDVRWAELDRLSAAVRGQSSEIVEFRNSLDRLTDITRGLRQQEGMELVIVTAPGRYAIVRSGITEAEGTHLGLHRLPTGVRFTAMTSTFSREFILQPGQPQAVELLEPVR